MLRVKHFLSRTSTWRATFRGFSAEAPSLDAVERFILEKGGRVHVARMGELTAKPSGGWLKFLQHHSHHFVVEQISSDISHGFNIRVKEKKLSTALETNISPEKSEYRLVDTLGRLRSFKDSLRFEDVEPRIVGLDVGSNGNIELYQQSEHASFDCNSLDIADVVGAIDPLLCSPTCTILLLNDDVFRYLSSQKETSSVAIQKHINLQLLGEYVFGTPFLSKQELFDALSEHNITSGAASSCDDAHLFQAVSSIIERNLSQDEIDLMIRASQESPKSNAGNVICFDISSQYKLYSAHLFRVLYGSQDHAFFGSSHVEHVRCQSILEILPERMKSMVSDVPCEKINEIVLDAGRRPQFWVQSKRHFFASDPSVQVGRSQVDYVVNRLGKIGADNRAGLPKELHRFSVMRDREGQVAGVTIRVGRHIEGLANLILDVLHGTNDSILVLGEPGSGKTTVIREITRKLSEENNVVVVDTSNEIGGDGSVPSESIGLARRMMVPSLNEQGAVMVECVQNHTPQVMVIDEIGRRPEVAAADTVKKRGVRLIASAHGNLHGLVENRQLSDLVGGVERVILGDDMAIRFAGSGNRGKAAGASKFSKVVSQRAGKPTFDVVIEIRREAIHEWRVVTDVASSVDMILNGNPYKAQIRSQNPATGEMTMRRVLVSPEGSHADEVKVSVKSDLAKEKDILLPFRVSEPRKEVPSQVEPASLSSNQTSVSLHRQDTPMETFQLSDGTTCRVVTDLSALQEFLQSDVAFDLATSDGPRRFIAMDCEGVPKNLNLLQLATSKGVYIVDCVQIGPKQVCETLQPVLSSPRIIKVLHDLRCDAKALYRHGKIISLKGVLDTQIVYEYLWEDQNGSLVGLNGFLERVGVPTHPSKYMARELARHTWNRRPLDQTQLEYAAWDVRLLLQAVGCLGLSENELSECLEQSQSRAQEAIAAEQALCQFLLESN